MCEPWRESIGGMMVILRDLLWGFDVGHVE